MYVYIYTDTCTYIHLEFRDLGFRVKGLGAWGLGFKV